MIPIKVPMAPTAKKSPRAPCVETDAQIVRYFLSGDSLLSSGGAVPILSGLPAFTEGQAAHTYEEFATHFAGPMPRADPLAAAFRPMGIPASADALYVSDGTKGRVWKISYVGHDSR